MLINLISYLKLAWLCFRLLIDLAGFLFIFLIKKASQKRYFEVLLILLIFTSLILHFYIIQQKTTVEIDLKKICVVENLDQSFQSKKTIFKEKELEESLMLYKEMEKQKINSLGLYLNLSQLSKSTKDIDAARAYFEKAQEIEPKIKYLEN